MIVDVAVIGAGPAGSMLAATLARRGTRVVLIDASHPREKPCGGGYTGRALALVRAHMPDVSIAGVQVRTARFLDTERQVSAVVPLDGSHELVVASRAVVDEALYQAAIGLGATPVQQRVVDVQPHGQTTLRLSNGDTISAATVIGADGANSLVRRRMDRAFPREDLSIATGFYAHGVTSDEVVLELVHDPPGYIWSFPRPDHLAIGICAQATDTTVGALRARVSRWVEQTGIARGARLEAYSWPIPALTPEGFTRTRVSGPGWMTIGDAAGLVDPLTREGLFFAMQSALFAADALQVTDPAEAARRYADRVRLEIVDDLRVAATLRSGFFQPAFAHLLIDALASSTRIQGVMADLVAGTQPYRTLRRRLIGTCELGLAWRWLQLTRGRVTGRVP